MHSYDYLTGEGHGLECNQAKKAIHQLKLVMNHHI